MCITTNKPVTKFNPNSNPNPTSKQHTTVSIQLPQCNVRCIQKNICGYKTMLLHRFTTLRCNCTVPDTEAVFQFYYVLMYRR